MPNPIEAHKSNQWKSKDLSEVEDLAVIEKTTDWSFSSPYKGTTGPLKVKMQEITREFQLPDAWTEKLSSENAQQDLFQAGVKRGAGVPEIPISMLG